jgi:hypothetical protein
MVRWVALGFDKKTQRLLQELELNGLTTDVVRRLLNLPGNDEAIGVSFNVLAEHLPVLAPYAHGRLDLATADWQIEARSAHGVPSDESQ